MLMERKKYMDLNDSKINEVVRIQGTKFDRKRKFSDKTLERMLRMVTSGMSYSEVAEVLGCSTKMVKYHTDEEYRYKLNHREGGGKHTGVDHVTPADRASYKRRLVKAGANVIINN